MAIQSGTLPRVDYTGDNSTDTYPYTWRINSANDLLVTQRDTSDVETNPAFTVTGTGEAGGGNVVLTAGNLATDYILTIISNETINQPRDIRNQGDFALDVIEEALDHEIRVSQRLKDISNRSVKLPETVVESLFDPTLPTDIETAAAGSAPITNSTQDGWAAASGWPTADNITNAQTYADDAEASADAAAASAVDAAASAVAADVSADLAAASTATKNPYLLNNIGIAASVAASALTIALKTADGSTDGSGGDPIGIWFRSSTLTTGSILGRTVTAALSIVVPSGATLGHNDALSDHIYLYAIDNAGTIELAVSSSNHWDEGQRITTTAIGTGSDDAATMYSTTSRTNVAFRLIGRLLSNQTTAGTWDAAITEVHVGNLFNPENITRAANFNAKHGKIYHVSTASSRTVTLPVAKSGWWCELKDSTGNAGSNNISIARAGSESINGVAANLSIKFDFGRWLITSDGTNFFVQGDGIRESLTVFVDVTNATATIPTTWASPTLSGAAITSGYPVTRSTNTLTFPMNGVYRIIFELGQTYRTAPGTASSVGVRLRNTTDGTTAATSTMIRYDLDGSPETIYNFSGTMFVNITDTSKDFELQWAASQDNTICQEDAVDSQDMKLWEFSIERVGNV
jgi:hypothetical protein